MGNFIPMSKIIDLSYLNEISGGDSNFIREMLELYVNTTATEAALFNDLLNRQDYEGIGHLAHKMKAPIQMLGANELFNLIRNLEHYGKEGSHIEQMPAIIEEIKKQVSLSISEINELLTSL